MFSFINSLVLPLIAAAFIPLILHLLNRQKLKTVPFSTIKFLKELQSKRIRQIKIYQLLVIIVRMLFVIFLVLAFARPALNTFLKTPLSESGTTAVVLLDNSLSMQARISMQTNFEKALNVLQKVLKTFKESDRVSIVTGSLDSENPVQVKFNQSFDLSQLKVSNFCFNWPAALRLAQKHFAAFPNYNKELILISDGKIPAVFNGDSLAAMLSRLSVRIYEIQITTQASFEDLSIDTAFVASQLIDLKQPLQVVATVENEADQFQESTISLYNRQNRLAMQLLRVPPQKGEEVKLLFTPRQTGWYELTLELEDDVLLADNRYFLSLNIPQEIKGLYVYRQSQAEVSAALRALSQKTNLKFKETNIFNWLAEPVSEYQLLIFDDPPPLNATQLSILKQYLHAGKNIIVIAGEGSALTDYNRMLAYLVKRKPFVEMVKSTQSNQFFTLKQTASSLRLLEPVFQKRPQNIDWPYFNRYFKLRRQGKVLFEFANGDPFLQAFSTRNGGRVFVLSANLSANWGDFPLRGLFIPFLHQLVALATYNAEENTQFVIGRPITITLPQIQLQQNFYLVKPDEQKITLIPEQTELGLTFFFEGFADPGHYRIVHQGRVLKSFAVNLDPKEWRKPYTNLQQVYPNLISLKAENFNEQTLLKARIGRELWPFFLLLAMLMLALEMWLIRKLEQG